MKTLIYLHGFNSSPQSQKACCLKNWCNATAAKINLQIPCLAFEPKEAAQQIEELIINARNSALIGSPLLIGSSLGGFYANYFAEKYTIKAALINPAVRPYELLSDYLGEQLNPYTGERYCLNEEHMEQLRTLNVSNMKVPKNRLVLLQTGDETLDYRQAQKYFSSAHLEVEQGGNHGFTGFEKKLGQIARFLELP